MKTPLFVFFCLFSALVYAQDISEAERPMSLGTQNSFSITLTETDAITVSKLWQEKVKKLKGKTKMLTYSDEIFTDNAIIPAISPNPVDVYAHAYDRGGRKVELQVWFFLGGVYLKSKDHISEGESARQMLRDFKNELGKAMMAIQLDQSEDKLRATESKARKMQGEREELLARIVKLEKELQDAKAALSTLEENEKIQAEIDEQAAEVEQLKSRLEQSEN